MLFLVVDDDALSRELLTLLLEAEAYEVETAESGEAAVMRAESKHLANPDVMLTDIQMPGLSGAALAKALREPLPNTRTLLIAMSGSSPEDVDLRGFDGFLLKPFQISELRAMVSTLNADANISEAVTHHVADPEVLDAEPLDSEALDSSALDEDIYTKLGELMPAEQLGQMYALCVSDARKRIAHMRVLAEAGDDVQYRAEAHAVKGGCGMIGAKGLCELAASAELSGLAPHIEAPGTISVTAVLGQLSRACDRLERILGKRTGMRTRE